MQKKITLMTVVRKKINSVCGYLAGLSMDDNNFFM